MLFIFLGLGAIALFSFLAVATFSDARRRERQSYYKSEAIKKVAESQGGEASLAYIREERSNSRRREIEGIRLGGMVCSGVGIGLMIFLHQIDEGEPVFWVGLIPLLVGVALLAHSYMMQD
jgi:hypothetical protein